MATDDVRSRLLDASEAARYLRTSQRWIRSRWAARELTGVKLGRQVRYRVEDLDRYIAEHTVEARR